MRPRAAQAYVRAMAGSKAVLLTLVAWLLMAGAATAAGPPPLGGEREVAYKGPGFELQALPNGRIEWLLVDARWNCPTMKRVKPFIAAGKPRIDGTRRVRASEKYDGARWSLRFSADWSRVSGSFSARANGCSTKKLSISGKRVRPAHTWAFGRFTGTTTQGFPIAFTVGWAVRYSRIEYFVKDVTLTVRLRCDDGSTTERALRSSDEGYMSTDSSLMASVSENGAYSPPEGMADGTLDGLVNGTAASGSVGASVSAGPVHCQPDGDGVTFTATRSA